MAHGSMTGRMRGAALLDGATYRDIAADASATSQAVGVVGLVALAAGLGSWRFGIFAMVGTAAGVLAGWVLWAAVAWTLGRILGGASPWGALLRALGFAMTPALLSVLAGLPRVEWLVWTLVLLWMLATGAAAVRHVMDTGTVRAVLTATVGLVPVAILRGIFQIG